MSGEFLILEKYVTGRNPADQVYVSLTSNKESVLARVALQSIVLSEAMSTGSPICVMNFVDGDSRLLSDGKLDYDSEFFLTIGNTPLQSKATVSMRISNVKFTNSGELGSTKAENVSFSVTFIHSAWDKIINEKKSRSWGSVKYSDVVKYIADECGFSSVDIESSNTIKESVIQPYLSNLGMLVYIQERAKSEKFDDIYEFGVDIKGNFFFRTISGIIETQRSAGISGDIPTLTFKPSETDHIVRREEKADNNGVPTTFFLFDGIERYVDNTISGGGGVNATYYDFETDSYTNKEIVYSDFNSYQMTDYTPVKKIHEDTKLLMYYGSNPDFDEVARADVSNIVNSYTKISITMDGNTEISIGQLVELIFPTPFNSFSQTPYSEVYSGFYVVGGVDHKFDMSVNTYVTTLNLIRNGFNGKFLSGYSKTKLGKFTK